MPIGSKNHSVPGGGLQHVAVQARDWGESLHFYCDLLGMEIALELGSETRRILMLHMGDSRYMELFQPKADTLRPGSDAANDPVTHIALTTTDAQAVIERVRRAGCKITVEPKDVELGGLNVMPAFFLGPSGEVIGLLQVND